DSGAPTSFMSSAYAEQHDVPVREGGKPLHLRTISGKRILKEGVSRHTRKVTLAKGDHSESLAFHVIPMYGYDLILGMPWLRRNEPTINGISGELTLPGRSPWKDAGTRRAGATGAGLLSASEFGELLEDEDSIALVGLLRTDDKDSGGTGAPGVP